MMAIVIGAPDCVRCMSPVHCESSESESCCPEVSAGSDKASYSSSEHSW